MSVHLVGFVNLVGVAYQDPRGDYTRLHYIAGFLDDFLAKEAPESKNDWFGGFEVDLDEEVPQRPARLDIGLPIKNYETGRVHLVQCIPQHPF